MSKLKKQLMALAILLAGFAAAFGTYLLLAPDDRRSGFAVQPAADALPVRDSSHRLTQPEKSELTVVEFLDFECEACGAYHPPGRTAPTAGDVHRVLRRPPRPLLAHRGPARRPLRTAHARRSRTAL
ncbi:hypothetical protein ACGF5O_14935 [Streptomyces sp. NPDC048291]|uniref:hypothetical protein n=1 Tax=Streptomyces sp. NPDC048291 TaxID=3365530 RepID=UPI0037110840